MNGMVDNKNYRIEYSGRQRIDSGLLGILIGSFSGRELQELERCYNFKILSLEENNEAELVSLAVGEDH